MKHIVKLPVFPIKSENEKQDKIMTEAGYILMHDTIFEKIWIEK